MSTYEDLMRAASASKSSASKPASATTSNVTKTNTASQPASQGSSTYVQLMNAAKASTNKGNQSVFGSSITAQNFNKNLNTYLSRVQGLSRKYASSNSPFTEDNQDYVNSISEQGKQLRQFVEDNSDLFSDDDYNSFIGTFDAHDTLFGMANDKITNGDPLKADEIKKANWEQATENAKGKNWFVSLMSSLNGDTTNAESAETINNAVSDIKALNEKRKADKDYQLHYDEMFEAEDNLNAEKKNIETLAKQAEYIVNAMKNTSDPAKSAELYTQYLAKIDEINSATRNAESIAHRLDASGYDEETNALLRGMNTRERQAFMQNQMGASIGYKAASEVTTLIPELLRGASNDEDRQELYNVINTVGKDITQEQFDNLDTYSKQILSQWGISGADLYNSIANNTDTSVSARTETDEATYKMESIGRKLYQKSDDAFRKANYGLDDTRKFVNELIPSAVGMAQDALVNIAVPGAGLASMFARVYSDSYNEAMTDSDRNFGVADMDKARLYGLVSSAIEVGTELLGDSSLVNKISYSTENIVDTIFKFADKDSILRAVTQGAFGEGMEEVVAEAVGPFAEAILSSNYGAELKKLYGEQTAEQYAKAFASGAIMALGGNAIGTTIGATSTYQGDAQTMLDDLNRYGDDKAKAYASKLQSQISAKQGATIEDGATSPRGINNYTARQLSKAVNKAYDNYDTQKISKFAEEMLTDLGEAQPKGTSRYIAEELVKASRDGLTIDEASNKLMQQFKNNDNITDVIRTLTSDMVSVDSNGKLKAEYSKRANVLGTTRAYSDKLGSQTFADRNNVTVQEANDFRDFVTNAMNASAGFNLKHKNADVLAKDRIIREANIEEGTNTHVADDSQLLLDLSKGVGNNAKLVVENYSDGQMIDDYVAEMNVAINMLAVNGATVEQMKKYFEDGTLTDQQIEVAYNRGHELFEAKNAEAKAKGEAIRKQRNGSTEIRRGSVSTDGGSYYENGEEVKLKAIDMKKLSKAQKGFIRTIEQFAEHISLNFVFFDGDAREAQGIYTGGNTIYININAGGVVNEMFAGYALSHELTHVIEKYSPEVYNKLSNFIKSNIFEISGGKTWEQLYNIEADKMGADAPQSAIEAEVIANSCLDMLENSTILTKLYEEDKSLAGKIRSTINKIMQRLSKFFSDTIGKYYAGYNPSSKNTLGEAFKQKQEFWDNGLKEALLNVNAGIDSNIDEQNYKESLIPKGTNFDVLDGNDSIQFQKAEKKLLATEYQLIKDVIDKSIDSKGSLRTKNNNVKISDVGPRLAAMVNSAFGGGFDISNKYIALDGSDIWHEFKRHTDVAKEISRDQVPLTKRRLINAIRTIYSPDIVEAIDSTIDNPKHRRAFAFAKRTVRGNYVVTVAVGGKYNPKINPIMFFEVSRHKWHSHIIVNGETIAEMIYKETDPEMLDNLDLNKIKNNRSKVTQFTSYEVIANTSPYVRSVNNISNDSEESNTQNQKQAWADNEVKQGNAISPDVEVQYSKWHNDDFMQKAYTYNKNTNYVPNLVMQEAERVRKLVNEKLSDPKLIEEMRLPDDEEGNTFMSNSSYGGSEEQTTVCIRSLAAQSFMDEVSKALGRPLTTIDTLIVSQEMMNYAGDMSECLYCYVAQDRRAYRDFLGKYLEQRDTALADIASGMSKEEAYTKFLNGRKDTKEMKSRFNLWVNTKAEELITPNDLASVEDLLEEIATNRKKKTTSGIRYRQLNDAAKYAQSASWAKKMKQYSAYNGHILKWKQDRINLMNSHFGLRMYSFSDFHPAFILENMQEVTDASVRGLKMLAYTKETDFAEIFAPTGMNINISVFASEVNGQIQKDGMMGADWDKAIALRKKYPNVGITLVATNDNLLKWGLENDDVDVVIPYHLVRTGAETARFFNYINYTDASSDGKLPGAKQKEVYPAEHNNDLITYMDKLAELNLTPRFPSWLNKYEEYRNGEITADEFRKANPYYMKLVNETRRSAVESPAVQPIFDETAALRSIENMKPYQNTLGQLWSNNEKLQKMPLKQTLKIINDMANIDDEAFRATQKPDYLKKLDSIQSQVNRVQNKSQKQAWADIDSEYMSAVNSKDMTEAQEMVNVAASKSGYTVHAYHGSPTVGITSFDKSKAGTNTSVWSDKAIWFTNDEEFANTFANKTQNTDYSNYIATVTGEKGTTYNVFLNPGKVLDFDNLSEEDYRVLYDGSEDTDISFDEFKNNLDRILSLGNHQLAKINIDYNLLVEKGYDLVKARLYSNADVERGKGRGDRSTPTSDAYEYGVLNPNQIKSADPVVYDDNGKVIPLSQRFNSQSNDIRFQKWQDSNGNQLTNEQVEFFKDSSVRDENGNLLVMYHGTANSGFTVFDTYGKSKYGLFGLGSYFTDDLSVAQSYMEKGRTRPNSAPGVYQVYLNITNPIDMDAEADATQWKKAQPSINFPKSGTNEVFYRAMEQYFGDNDYYAIEAAEEAISTIESMGYDGITHIGGGRFNSRDENRHRVYIAFESEQIKSTNNLKPTDNIDIRYQQWQGESSSDYASEAKDRSKELVKLKAENVALEEQFNAIKTAYNDLAKTVKTLEKSNKKLTEKNKKLIAEFKDTPLQMREEDLTKLAREYAKEYGVETKELAYALSYLANGVLLNDKMSYEQYKQMALDLASMVIDKANVIVDDKNIDLHNYIKGYLKNTIVVPKENRNDLDGGYDYYRKAHLGTIKLGNKGEAIDTVYEQMQKAYGESIFPNVSPAEMVERIVELYDATDTVYGNPYEGHRVEATQDLANRMIADISSEKVRMLPQTFKDKMQMDAILKAQSKVDNLRKTNEARIAKLKANASARLEQRVASEKEAKWDALEKANEKFAERLAKAKANKTEAVAKANEKAQKRIDRLNERLAEERNDKWQRVSDIKNHYRQKESEARYRRQNKTSRTKIGKLINQLNSMLKHPTETKHIPVELTQLTIDILSMIDRDTGKNKSIQKDIANMAKVYESYKNNERYSMVYDDVVAQSLQTMYEQIGSTPLNRMTNEQLDAVYNVLKSLMHVARTAVKVKIGNEERNAFEVSTEMTNETRNAKVPRSDLVTKYLSLMLKPADMFDLLGGFKKDSAWSKMAKMFADAETKQENITMQLSLGFNDLVNNSKEMDKFMGYKEKDLVDIGLVDEDEGKVIKVSHDIMMGIYMDLLNEENKRHFLYAGKVIPNLSDFYHGKNDNGFGKKELHATGYSAAFTKLLDQLEEARTEKNDNKVMALEAEIAQMQLDAEAWVEQIKKNIEEKMTDFDKQWLQACQELFDEKSKKILNDTTMEIYGITKANVEHYFPITTDKDFLSKPFESVTNDMNLENVGFMKQRIVSKKPTLALGVVGVSSRQISNVGQYAAIMPAMRTFNKVYGKTQKGYADSLQKAIHTKFGDVGLKYIDDIMGDLVGSRSAKGSIDKLFTFLRGNLAPAVLTGNPRVALAQTASFPTAAAKLGWKPIGKALLHGGKDGRMISRADKELIAQYSPKLWYRMQGYSSVEIGDIKNSNQLGAKIWRKLGWFTGWIQAFDGATVGRLWDAAQYYVDDNFSGLEKGSTEYYEKVAEVYNETINATQPVYGTFQRPAALRDPSALAKSLFMFMTQRLQNFNVTYSAAAKYQKYRADFAKGLNNITEEDVKNAQLDVLHAGTAMVAQGLTLTVFKFLADVLLHNMDKYRDDDDELTAESIALKLLDMFIDAEIGCILFGAELYAIGKALIGEEKWYGLSVNGVDALTDTIQDLISLTTKPSMKTFTNFANDIAQDFGIPAKNAYNLVNAMLLHGQDMLNGEFLSFEAGLDRKDAQNASLLIKAYNDGDEDAIAKYTAEFETESAALSAMESVIRKQYQDDDISYDDAKDFLVEHDLAFDEDEADKMLYEWEKGKGSATVYDGITEALTNNDKEAFKTAMAEMTEHGYDESTIYNRVKTETEKMYVETKTLDKQSAIQYLMDYAGKDKADATDIVEQWTCKVVTGIDYNDIGDYYMAYVNGNKDKGITSTRAIEMLMRYGKLDKAKASEKVLHWELEAKTGIVYGSSTKGIKNAVIEGDITEKEASQYIVKYGGKTKEVADRYASQYSFEKKTGYSWGDVAEAYKNHKVSETELVQWQIKCNESVHGSESKAKKYVELTKWQAKIDGFTMSNYDNYIKSKKYIDNANLSNADISKVLEIYKEAESQYDDDGNSVKNSRAKAVAQGIKAYGDKAGLTSSQMSALMEFVYAYSTVKKVKLW